MARSAQHEAPRCTKSLAQSFQIPSMGLLMEKMEDYRQIPVLPFRIKLDKSYFDGFLRWSFALILKNFKRFGSFSTFTDIIHPILPMRRICILIMK